MSSSSSGAQPPTCAASFQPRLTRVLHAGVQALTAGGQVDVSGVARDQDPAFAVGGGQLGGVAERADPEWTAVGDVLAGQPVPGARELRETRRLGPPLRWRGPFTQDDPVDAVADRPDDHHAQRQRPADHPRFERAARDVGEHQLTGGFSALEADARESPDETAAAVAANDVVRAQVARSGFDLHAAVGLCEPDDLLTAADVGAERGGPLGEHGLGAGLGDAVRAVVRAVEYPEVHRQPAEMPAWRGLEFPEQRENAPLIENLHGPRGQIQSA